MQYARPIAQVLLRERQVEEVLVAQSRCIGWSCALAEHLLDGVAGNQVNEQKDQRNNQPYDRKSEREAGEDRLHGAGTTINQGSGFRGHGSV